MRRWLLLLGLVFATPILHADSAAFDLAGPKVDVRIKRGDQTLPIAQVPNLLEGDRIWVHPDFPEDQTNRFVLVVAFLRGATNQPPADWFTRVETWNRDVRSEGVYVTVPHEAEQAVLFLAPETGGDFSTLRKAVHDRPGIFVRANQDLQAASLDRMRLDAYLDDVRTTSQTDPKALKEKAELSARSLGIKLDNQCFDKPSDQQAPCLTQHTDGLVLDDANTQSMVNQLANGATGDLLNQLSYSQAGGYGMYSAYVGAIVDTAKILSSLHTAHFQYIPALALPTKDTLNLRLNVAPSFRDPKSVVVIALPPIGPVRMPPLRPVNAEEAECLQKPDMVLAAEGAPQFFGSQYAHDLKLRIDTPAQKDPIEIPLRTESARGGLLLALTGGMPPLPTGKITATVHGLWGFDTWEGPHFHLFSPQTDGWSVASEDQSALVIGRQDKIHIEGDGAVCIDKLTLSAASGKETPLTFKAAHPGAIEVEMPLADVQPGTISVEIHQYGLAQPDVLHLHAYAEAASLDRLTLSAGDPTATLKGTRLDEVAKATLGDITWTPGALARVQDFDQLTLKTTSLTDRLPLTPPDNKENKQTAKVQLRDGREIKVPVTILPPKPQVTLVNKGTQDDGTPLPIKLGSPDDLPLDSKLVFFLKSDGAQTFPRNQNVEVAATDGGFRTTLSVADGTLVLEDAHTALGTVEPLKNFGPSAFGPLRARAISPEGVPSEWMPLGTLVRMPGFKDLRCPHNPLKSCTLTGTNLFLVQSIGGTQDLANAIDVPFDFTGGQLTVPHPTNGTLYLKLRDDPNTVQALNLPVTPLAPTQASAAPVPPPIAPKPPEQKPADQQPQQAQPQPPAPQQ